MKKASHVIFNTDFAFFFNINLSYFSFIMQELHTLNYFEIRKQTIINDTLICANISIVCIFSCIKTLSYYIFFKFQVHEKSPWQRKIRHGNNWVVGLTILDTSLMFPRWNSVLSKECKLDKNCKYIWFFYSTYINNVLKSVSCSVIYFICIHFSAFHFFRNVQELNFICISSIHILQTFLIKYFKIIRLHIPWSFYDESTS